MNLYSFKISTSYSYSEVFDGISSYVKFCINDASTKNNLLGDEITSVCDDACFQSDIKIDIKNNGCVPSCKDIGNLYEYNNICYDECPGESYELFCVENECDDTKKCLDIISEGYFFDINVDKLKKCY